MEEVTPTPLFVTSPVPTGTPDVARCVHPLLLTTPPPSHPGSPNPFVLVRADDAPYFTPSFPLYRRVRTGRVVETSSRSGVTYTYLPLSTRTLRTPTLPFPREQSRQDPFLTYNPADVILATGGFSRVPPSGGASVYKPLQTGVGLQTREWTHRVYPSSVSSEFRFHTFPDLCIQSVRVWLRALSVKGTFPSKQSSRFVSV